MSNRSRAVKRLSTWAFVVVVSAFLLASLINSRREPPMVRIREIRPVMNFSRVCVQGVLESEARMLRDGTILYLVADETGSLPVFLNRGSTGAALPGAGERIAATGYLNVGAGNRMSMRVHDPEQIEILDTAAPVIIRGRVFEVWTPPLDSRAPYRIVLDRPEGRLEVVHWFVPEHHVAVGDQVEAEGVLGFYKDRKQLKVREAGDIRLYPGG